MVIDEKYFIIIDIVILLLYVLFLFKGIRNGFVYQLVTFILLIASLGVAWFASPVMASNFKLIDIKEINNSIINVSSIETLINTITWFIIITIICIVLFIVIRIISKKVSKIPVIGLVNRILGGIFGIVNATIVVCLLSIVLSIGNIKNVNDIKDKTLFKYISNLSDKAGTYIVNNIDLSKVKDKVDDFDVNKAREEFLNWIIEQRNNNE